MPTNTRRADRHYRAAALTTDTPTPRRRPEPRRTNTRQAVIAAAIADRI